ncbi:hypothetical protein GSI_07323 [Ganoderma sinense ZZ0214-1]|uniref:MYND-type domain-containing protein n=1 Tax=Ganoderma sinense ZZ0214-1 TaxID=1077348 RepID=A0A2G8SA55_9APHY|nr:hypothetical protein GSI_07323 [Ganoderma sinense ZZ0214-1]
MLYCTKQCQKRAWEFHKDLCGPKTEEEAAKLGYSSMASVVIALKRWASAHTWALQAMVEAIAHKTGGGIDDHLENQRAIVFVVSQGKQDRKGPRNPAKAFHLDNGGLVHKAEQYFLDENWHILESRCNNLTAAMRASLPETERRAFAGFINVAFHFLPTGMTSFHHYPVYRLRTHGGRPSYDISTTEEERALYSDVVQICSSYLTQGLALRAPGGDYNRPSLPEVGSYERVKKKWTWVRFPNYGWSTYKAKDSPPKLTAETLMRYHGLLAQRNFDENLFDASQC